MKKQLLSRKRLSQLLYSIGLFLLCLNVSWGQTTVYHETFGTAAVANPYGGGTSSVPTNITYTPVITGTGTMSSSVVLASGDGYLYNNVGASSQNSKLYLPAPFSGLLNNNISANTGLITWTVNWRTTRTTVFGSATNYNDSNTYGGVILCSNSSNLTGATSTGVGYAVIMTRSSSSSTQNAIRLVKMNSGFTNNSTSTTNPTLIEGLPFSTFTGNKSVKVTYDPATGIWELWTREDAPGLFSDPTSGASYVSAGTSNDATHTSTAMSSYGCFSSNTASTTGFQYDNFKIVLSPPPSAPLITLGTAFTAFSYEGNGPSASQSTLVTGTNLSGNITIDTSVLTKYEVSLDNFFTTPATGTLVVPNGGTLSVRLKANLGVGSHNETITLASVSDSYTKTINCVGAVTASYTYSGSGSLSNVNNWLPIPPSLTETNSKYYISGTAVTDAAWTLGAGSKIIVNSSTSLTIADTFPVVGTIDVNATGSLFLQADVYPTLGTLNATSNVHLQKQPIGNFSQAVTFGNVFIDGGSSATISIGSNSTGSSITGALTVNTKLTVAADTNLYINSTVYNAFYFTGSAVCEIQGLVKSSRAINLVSFGAGLSTVTGAPGLQFANAENVGVNFILGPASTVEFSRSNSSTPQVITPRSDYHNLSMYDASSTTGATGNIKTVAGAVGISGILTLNNTFFTGSTPSAITGTGPFVLGDGAIIIRTSGSFGTAVPIVFGTTVDIEYEGGGVYTPGNEMPTSSSVLNDLSVKSGTTLNLVANTTVNGDIFNNGTITIPNNVNLIQTKAGISGNIGIGEAIVNRNSSDLKRLDYTLWSSPVVGQKLIDFSPLTVNERFYTYNSASNSYTGTDTSQNFIPGTGYLIRMPDNASTTPTAYAGQFTGTLNNGDISISSLTAGQYVAVGNPYPSVVNMNDFINGNSTDGTLYFWRKTNGALGTAYASYNLTGVTVTSDPGTGGITPNGHIQVGQGFIVKATSTSLNFTNAMRETNPTSTQILKTKKVVQQDRIWLNMTTASGVFSQALVGYIDGATLGIDNGYDAKYLNDSPVALTSSINGGEYTIQGRPAFDATDVVALNFKTDVAGDYTIAIDHTDGVFAAGQDVYLVDSKTGTETDLKAGSYTFAAVAGTDNARFSLKYQKTLKVIAPEFNENSVRVYSENGTLYVNSGAIAIQNIRVFDIQGRLVAQQNNVKANSASISNLKAHQALIVQVTSEDNAVVSKKVVN